MVERNIHLPLSIVFESVVIYCVLCLLHSSNEDISQQGLVFNVFYFCDVFAKCIENDLFLSLLIYKNSMFCCVLPGAQIHLQWPHIIKGD